MSSIHTVWTKAPQSSPLINTMLSACDYWQPDNTSQWNSLKSSIALAKALLVNAKNSQHDNVFCDENAGLTITANARIDNRKQLLLLLELTNEQVTTDSELILAMYQKYGVDCPKHLRGDFVFIIWDEDKQQIFCARDHFGVKTLFYSHTHDGIMISNEHNAFFTTNWADNSVIDEEVFIHNVWNLGSHELQSSCSTIDILAPAHYLVVNNQGIQTQRYWQLESKNDWQHLTDEALLVELKKRFQQSVEDRCNTDFVLGTELSEGLDSNGVAGYAARFLPNNTIYTFSYMCEALTNENQHIWADTYKDINEMLALYPNLESVWQSNPLHGEGDIVHQQKKQQIFKQCGGVLSKKLVGSPRIVAAQSKNVRVLLSGWGGDHCVTNPAYQYADELAQQGKLLTLYRHFQERNSRVKSSDMAYKAQSPVKAVLFTFVKNWFSLLYVPLQVRRGLGQALRRRLNKHSLKPIWRNKYYLVKKFHAWQKSYLRYTVKSKEHLELFEIGLTNRLTLSELEAKAARIEYRFPMLDVDLVEFAHNLPARLKIHQGVERFPFREVLKEITTERIRMRDKGNVDTPKFDKISQRKNKKINIVEKLESSALFKRYCDLNQVKKFDYDNDPMMLGDLQYLLDVECYYTTVQAREEK